MQDLKVILMQTSPVWEKPDQNLILSPDSIKLISEGSLVVFPEMFSTGFSMNVALAETHPGEACAWLQKMAKNFGAAFAGSVMVQENGKYLNRFYFATPDSQLIWYDKRHLFSLAGENEKFTAGTRQVLANWNGWKIALFTCYDLRFPVWCRRTPHFDYHIAIFVASWPDRRSLAWRTLLKARAIENQCAVVAVNRCGYDGQGVLHAGDSVIFDWSGKIIAFCKPYKPQTVSGIIASDELITFREQLPFQKDSDDFTLNI